MRYREPNSGDWSARVLMVLLYIGVAAISAFFIFPQGTTGKILFAVIVTAGLLLLLWWHLRSIAFRCESCGHEFELSWMSKITSPHAIVWYEIRCPECRQRIRAKVLIKER